MTTPVQMSFLLVIAAISSIDRFALSQTVNNLSLPPVFRHNDPLTGYSRGSYSSTGNPAIIPQNWARGNQAIQNHYDQTAGSPGARQSFAADLSATEIPMRRNSLIDMSNNGMNMNMNKPAHLNNKSVRHIVSSTTTPKTTSSSADDICADRLCYGLPSQCLGGPEQGGPLCSVLVTSKRYIEPGRPASRDILFELIALPNPDSNNYAAVGFSETGRMQGLVSECVHLRDGNRVELRHSYNIPGAYTNVPINVLSGIKSFSTSFENGYYQCRWIVDSAVEFSYEALNGTVITRREDLGYKNYHILLASGQVDSTGALLPHSERSSSTAPVSLAQTGQIKSLGSHILIRIHGSLMIAIWVGLVTLSIVLARYYKNEWSHSRVNDLAIWFVVHRAFMLTAWFGSIIAVVFAYIYTETYHPGFHQLSGTACLVLSTVQVLGGLFRPSSESSKRIYFNWTHFVCGNLSYLFAMICLITASFLAPAHLPPLYIWVIVIFVAAYALTHLLMTVHQYIIYKSSKISITPMSDLNSSSSATYTTCGLVADSYPKEVNSPFRQFMLGILVTIIVIFIVLLISLVNIK